MQNHSIRFALKKLSLSFLLLFSFNGESKDTPSNQVAIKEYNVELLFVV